MAVKLFLFKLWQLLQLKAQPLLLQEDSFQRQGGGDVCAVAGGLGAGATTWLS